MIVSIAALLGGMAYGHDGLLIIFACPLCTEPSGLSFTCALILLGVAYVVLRGWMSFGIFIRWVFANWKYSRRGGFVHQSSEAVDGHTFSTVSGLNPAMDLATIRKSKLQTFEYTEMLVLLFLSALLVWHLLSSQACHGPSAVSHTCFPDIASLLAPWLAIVISYTFRWGPQPLHRQSTE